MKFNVPLKRQNKEHNKKEDLTNVFEDFLSDFYRYTPSFWHNQALEKDYRPDIDIAETDKSYLVEAELPGVKEKDIEIKLENDVLKIKGKKESEKTEEEKNFYTKERVYGEFQRSITLPKNIDKEHIKANFKEGVLEINIPKSKEKGDIHKISINK